jgi:hypothetical protein
VVVRYCTLFDRRYATRGLVMLESLERFRRPGDEIVVLALDAEARGLVERLGKGRWRAVSIDDLQDRELTELRPVRPEREFCWTCTPAFSAWMVRRAQEGDIVVYLDADLMFFDDPRKLLAELESGGSVLIHEHRFSPDRASYEPSSGRFNVGFVGFNVGPEGRACAERWRAQTIERCELDPDNGYCGDQGYLNEWPTRYPHARVMRNIGGGVAPWNVNQYAVGNDGEVPTVDRVPVVFFHYHAFKTLFNVGLGVVAAEPAYGYEFSTDVIRAFFRPYVRQLRKAIWAASGVGIRFEPDRKLAWRDVLSGIKRSRYILTI